MESLRVTASGAALRYLDIDGPGRPLVCVHGLGCAATADFPRVLAHPACPRRRAILVDLLGSGFSDRPEDFPYSMAAHADVVVALVDRLGLSTIDVFGHSMGGSIAIDVTTRLGRRVGQLIAAEPNLDAGGGTFSRAIARYPEARYVARGHRAVIRAAVDGGNDAWAGTMAASSATAVHREACALVAGERPSWREQIEAVAERAVVLFGERSLPDPDADRLRAAGVAVEVVADAGHSMLWENPGEVAMRLAEAWARADEGEAAQRSR